VPEAEPGQSLEVLIRWQSLAALPADYVVSLQLYDDQEGHQWGLGTKQLVDVGTGIYFDERGYPRAALLPTSEWPVGETSLQVHQLPIDIATPPGTYRVKLRVHPADSWVGLPLLDASGQTLGYDADLGQVVVLPASSPVDESELPIHRRLDVMLAPGVELLGTSPVPDAALPGDTISLSLWWQAVEATMPGCAFELALTSAQGTIAQKAAPLCDQPYPDAWQEGQIRRQQISLAVARNAAPGSYILKGRLLADGQELGNVDLGTLSVPRYERQLDAPPPNREASLQFGDGLELVGYGLPSDRVLSSSVLPVTLYWHALETMDVSYTVSVRLVNDNGEIVAQHDRLPGEGAWPTTAWVPGEYVADTCLLKLPEDTVPGRYQLIVVWYDLATGIPLKVSSESNDAVRGNGGVVAIVRVDMR